MTIASTPFILCVTGNMFSFITSNTSDSETPSESESLVSALVELAMAMNSVIFCRVFPKQKSEVVNLMKKRTKQVTLGIGDGGNDVIMIQNSDVGVGIIGKEGQQAARAADYVISEFKYLKRLCCVHGVDSISRSWTIGNYSFYKSIIFCIIQTGYAMYSSYSGVSLFNSIQVTLYNILLFVPIVSMVTKRIYEEHELLNDPLVYQYYNDTNQKNKRTLFSFPEFIISLIMGVVQALVLEVFAKFSAGYNAYDYLANTVFFSNLCTQDIIMLMLLPNITWLNFWAILFCHVAMWLLSFICSSVMSLSGFVPYMSMQYTNSQWLHWISYLVLVTIPCVVMLVKKL